MLTMVNKVTDITDTNETASWNNRNWEKNRQTNFDDKRKLRFYLESAMQ